MLTHGLNGSVGETNDDVRYFGTGLSPILVVEGNCSSEERYIIVENDCRRGMQGREMVMQVDSRGYALFCVLQRTDQQTQVFRLERAFFDDINLFPQLTTRMRDVGNTLPVVRYVQRLPETRSK